MADDDLFDSLRVVALPLDMETLSTDFDPSVPPTNGAEYLQRVILEASRCKEVVVANIDERKLKQQDFVNPLPGCESAPDMTMVPTKEWQQCQVADFSSLRQKISRLRDKCTFPKVKLPDSSFENGWYRICIGAKEGLCPNGEILPEACPMPPLVSYLLNPSMTQQALEGILVHNINWMQSSFTENQAKWIYSLLACLELPLTPSICSTLRMLARECASLRTKLNSTDSVNLVPLNLFICLVANYFQQTDLADKYVVESSNSGPAQLAADD